MRINNNIMALNTHRQYSINNTNISKSTEKLSSGYRINRAGDDAAGLAISEKMRAQIRGLNMAAKNSNDAISLVQTAEGALTETHAILQRMRELAVQAASDTNDDNVDRAALDAEFQQLKYEIDDIADKTTFNGKNLLDGSFGSTTKVSDSSTIELPSVDVDGITPIAGTNDVVSITFEGFTESGSIVFAEVGTSGDDYEVTYDNVTLTVKNEAGAQTMVLDFGQGRIATLVLGENAGIDGFSDLSLDFEVSGTVAKIQTGANADENLDISIDNMGSAALGLTDSIITSQADANSAIATVDAATNKVSTQRAQLGAIQNRLEHKINNLNTSAENLTAAESRIRDIDMAKEITEFTKHNILVQASTAMLAQANQAPQNVLALLK
jgi:flagellin